MALEKGTGIKEGDRINLKQVIGRDGKTLADMVDSKPMLLAAVKSECGMCRIATDAMRYIREEVGQAGIRYYIAVLNPASSSSGFEYIDSLGIDVPAFLWNGEPESIPEVVPYHLLLDQAGVIIKRWPGSNQDKAIRDRMANQIVIDTLRIAAPEKE
ncbi:MAG TPA: hypothetical protein VNN73_00465 [Blastocatellia bacterium]|nr:hypothetical protein [Blastocatellia bacterium]